MMLLVRVGVRSSVIQLVKDLDGRTECTISKFAVDSELDGVADTPEACATVQWDLDRLETLMNLTKASV